MCSFLVYYIKNHSNVNLKELNHKLKMRGPDVTNIKEFNDYCFLHNLLHITGKKTVQPFIENNIVALFNGQIYNYKDFDDKYQTDGECLIPLYKKYGTDFVKYLDGDFAVVVYDFEKQIAILSSDVFATKPIWFGKKNGKLYTCSFKSPLEKLKIDKITKIPANKTLIFNLNNALIVDQKSVYDFDLTQHKNTYDDWISAFKNSIKKRTNNLQYPVFICLSSGYDSGVIACILKELGIEHHTFTIDGIENKKIMNLRLENTINSNLLTITKDMYYSYLNMLSINGESIDIKHRKRTTYDILPSNTKNKHGVVYYNPSIKILNAKVPIKFEGNKKLINEVIGVKEAFIVYDKSFFYFTKTYKGTDKIMLKRPLKDNEIITIRNKNITTPYLEATYNPLTDWASVGLAHIFEKTKEKNMRIYLSGQGGDEIYADYGFAGIPYKSSSQFGGLFPKDLSTIFPWFTFYKGQQEAFIAKEEHISSIYGIEGRYPFLDKQVVQEFLWLSQSLKNKYYKAPLHVLMEKYNYPFNPNEKIGFKVKRILFN